MLFFSQICDSTLGELTAQYHSSGVKYLASNQLYVNGLHVPNRFCRSVESTIFGSEIKAGIGAFCLNFRRRFS